jgi:ABC-type antimicrobial peptide transport system permease subunit
MRRILSSLGLGAFTAFREIRAQPLRSGLSIAGVALAVGALSALLSLITGLQGMARDSVSDMGGAGRMSVRPSKPTDALEAMAFSRSPGLRESDGELARDSTHGAITVLKTQGDWARVRFLGSDERVYLMGSDRDYLVKDVSAQMVSGRLPDAGEYERGDAVALLGWNLATSWGEKASSRGRELVGSTVVIGGVPLEIVGTFKFKRNNWGRNGNTVAIPWSLYRTRFAGTTGTLDELPLRVEIPESSTVVQARLEQLLTGAHRGAKDYSFQLFEFMGEITRMIGNISLLLGTVAALSLSVGALGIFNTMLAGFHDRIREIGVRKALGARRFQILAQFLAEAVVLSSLGGVAGLAIGSLPSVFGDQLHKAVSIRPVLDLAGMLQAFGISVLVGVVAGLWPAIRAARLDAVDALRYE